MGLFGFGDDTYSKDYLMSLGRKYGINAEAGHLQEKGINVISNGDGTY